MQIAIEQAKYYDKCTALTGGDKTACQIDKALVNLGALFLEKVEGRVSTEVDPKVARDTGVCDRGMTCWDVACHDMTMVGHGRMAPGDPAAC